MNLHLQTGFVVIDFLSLRGVKRRSNLSKIQQVRNRFVPLCGARDDIVLIN